MEWAAICCLSSCLDRESQSGLWFWLQSENTSHLNLSRNNTRMLCEVVLAKIRRLCTTGCSLPHTRLIVSLP